MPNKVKFNLKNVHIAPFVNGSYEDIFAIPGAVSLTLDANGDISKFYADGIVYYQSATNGGYDGDLEMAMIPDEFREKILKEIMDSKKVLVENANVEPVPFALGFQIDGDASNTYFWFYNCAATRPSTEASTTEDTKDPQTDTLSISCAPNASGNVRAKTTDETDSATKNAWFDSVYEPTVA